MHGPVPVILAEDETKVKARITWAAKIDVLAGFCGPKEDHKCLSDFQLLVDRTDRQNWASARHLALKR